MRTANVNIVIVVVIVAVVIIVLLNIIVVIVIGFVSGLLLITSYYLLSLFQLQLFNIQLSFDYIKFINFLLVIINQHLIQSFILAQIFLVTN